MEPGLLRLKFDFTNFTEQTLGLGRGLLEDDIEKIQNIAPRIHAAVEEQYKDGKLPYLSLGSQDISGILEFAAGIKDKYDNIAVLGIGGSALGLTALRTALSHPFPELQAPGERGDSPRLYTLDNIDPYHFKCFTDAVELKRTLFFVISKSGATAETMSQYLVIRNMLVNGGLSVREHLVVITDPQKGELREIVRRDRLTSFPIPDGVGGRFSVFTPVGLVPAAAAGMDIKRLLSGLQEYVQYTFSRGEVARDNPSLFIACALYLLYRKGYTNHVMMPYSNRLRDVADWYRQLWAESLGKKYDRSGRLVEVGATPIKALGATDQHSQVQLYAEGPRDKAFIFVGVSDFEREVIIPSPKVPGSQLEYLGSHTMNELIATELRGTICALTDAGRPNCLIECDKVSPETVAQMFTMWELAVSYIGELFDINVYDQPGVEAGKAAAYALMGRPGYEETAAGIRSREIEDSGLRIP